MGIDYFIKLMSRNMIEPSKVTAGTGNSRLHNDLYQVQNLVRQISIFKSEDTTRKSAFGTGHRWPLVPVIVTGTPEVVPKARAFGIG